MSKKKILFVLAVVFITSGLIYKNKSSQDIVNNPTVEAGTLNVENKTSQALYDEVSSLDQLKTDANIIVEAIGTDIVEERDYKGINVKVSIIKVSEVIKGDIKETELKILQDAETDTIPKKNERLLMFLKKGIDNKDCYIPVGGDQGIYRVVENKQSEQNNVRLASTNSSNFILEARSLQNDKILKDLKGDYEQVKKMLK